MRSHSNILKKIASDLVIMKTEILKKEYIHKICNPHSSSYRLLSQEENVLWASKNIYCEMSILNWSFPLLYVVQRSGKFKPSFHSLPALEQVSKVAKHFVCTFMVKRVKLLHIHSTHPKHYCKIMNSIFAVVQCNWCGCLL